MNTAELNPTVPQEVIDAQFADITANMNMAPVYTFNISAESLNLTEKGFKTAAEMGNVAVNNEVQFDGADYMKTNEEVAAIARKADMLYHQSGTFAAHATEQMARVTDVESDEDER